MKQTLRIRNRKLDAELTLLKLLPLLFMILLYILSFTVGSAMQANGGAPPATD